MILDLNEPCSPDTSISTTVSFNDLLSDAFSGKHGGVKMRTEVAIPKVTTHSLVCGLKFCENISLLFFSKGRQISSPVDELQVYRG